MRLLEYATVVVGNGHWMKGWQAEARECGLSVEVFDPCGVVDHPLVAGGGTDLYDIVPFGIKASLPRSLMCAQEDDEEWLRKATKQAAEPGVGYSLTAEIAAGNDTWIGDNTAITAANVPAGRLSWQNHNVGEPALHLADDKMVTALTNHEVLAVGNQMLTVWGDPVVNSPGYLAGTVFWSGPITVYLSDIDVDTLFKQASNDSRVIANLVAAVDMPPCQVVKIGA